MLTPDDLDAAWFTATLQDRYPGTTVETVEQTRVDEWTNVHVRVTLTHDGSVEGAPRQVFVKLPPGDPDKARGLGSARMGAAEARFYMRLAPSLDLRVPEPYGAVIEDDGGFAIVIEDLQASGCTPHNLVGVTPDAAAVALEDLARMHRRYERPDARGDESVKWVVAPPLPPPGAELPPNLGQKLLRRGIAEQPERLGDAYVSVAESWIADGGWFQQIWWDAPLTVIHGDAHPGNLFDDDGRIGFLDWGLVTLGDPLRDVSYFLCLALDIEVRRSTEVDLLAHYLDVRRGLGGDDIDTDHAWTRHRLHAAYTVPASCQALAVSGDASDGARRFSDLFLDRAIAAVEDLEVPDALAAARRGLT